MKLLPLLTIVNVASASPPGLDEVVTSADVQLLQAKFSIETKLEDKVKTATVKQAPITQTKPESGRCRGPDAANQNHGYGAIGGHCGCSSFKGDAAACYDLAATVSWMVAAEFQQKQKRCYFFQLAMAAPANCPQGCNSAAGQTDYQLPANQQGKADLPSYSAFTHGGDWDHDTCMTTESVCKPGQTQANGPYSFRSSDNSYSACQNKCIATPGCVAFDYTNNTHDSACRGVPAKQNPRSDPGHDKRQYCTYLWPQVHADKTRCNGDDGSEVYKTTQIECQNDAMEQMKRAYQYDTTRCKEKGCPCAVCDDSTPSKTNTDYGWKIYEQP